MGLEAVTPEELELEAETDISTSVFMGTIGIVDVRAAAPLR